MLENCQIKSAEKFREICKAIDIIEKETFIKSGQFQFKNVWVCPDIDLMVFYNSADPTENVVARICIHLHVKLYGKTSDAQYLEVVKKHFK